MIFIDTGIQDNLNKMLLTIIQTPIVEWDTVLSIIILSLYIISNVPRFKPNCTCVCSFTSSYLELTIKYTGVILSTNPV